MQCKFSLITLISMTWFIYKAVPINDTNYSCHMKAIELVEPIILGPCHAISCTISYILITSGDGGHTRTQTHTHTHTHTHTLDFSDKGNFKKPCVCLV